MRNGLGLASGGRPGPLAFTHYVLRIALPSRHDLLRPRRDRALAEPHHTPLRGGLASGLDDLEARDRVVRQHGWRCAVAQRLDERRVEAWVRSVLRAVRLVHPARDEPAPLLDRLLAPARVGRTCARAQRLLLHVEAVLHVRARAAEYAQPRARVRG